MNERLQDFSTYILFKALPQYLHFFFYDFTIAFIG